MQMRDLDSYIAGIFDGEGSISATHRVTPDRRFRTALMLSVQMQNKDIPEMLFRRLGGSLRGPYTRPGANKPFYQWYVNGASARLALNLFADLCVLKKQQAELALVMVDLLEATDPVTGKRRGGGKIVTDENLVRRQEIADEIKLVRANA